MKLTQTQIIVRAITDALLGKYSDAIDSVNLLNKKRVALKLTLLDLIHNLQVCNRKF